MTSCLGRKDADEMSKDVDEIEFETAVVKLAAGRNHVMALSTKGRVYTWGKNEHGQCGHGD